jgi:rRNA maturation RNase YbeY
MNVIFFNEGIDFPNIDTMKIIKWVNQVVEFYSKIAGDINYIFCSDDYLLEINTKYLEHDFYTDIVTFNYCEDNLISGDIFISLDRVKENATEYNTQDSELLRVIIHGVLHLIGLDDHSDEERLIMRKAEDDAIKSFD